MKNIKHVIWDWNGTLFDDFEITARSCIIAMEKVGGKDISYDDVREHHTRPFDKLFLSLVGRPATAEELAAWGDGYVEMYEKVKRDLPLATDALASLDYLDSVNVSQSILSMAPHEELVELVNLHQITERFLRVDGATSRGLISKQESLEKHLDALGVAPNQTAMIGDTLDDFDAAAAVGVQPLLVSTGMYAAHRLRASGAPVAECLLDAVKAATHTG